MHRDCRYVGMPYSTREAQIEYQRNWMRQRRAKWLAENGPCVRCGIADRLEVHHRDPAEKVTHSVWSWSEARRLAELAKCEVLCYNCHKVESSLQRAQQVAANEHGTLARYKTNKCRCTACCEANAAYELNRRSRSKPGL